MTDIAATAVETTIDRYFASWNEVDPSARTGLVRSAFAEDGRYVDPLADATGHPAIADMMGAVQEQYPGMTVRRTSPLDQHHDVIRFHWDIVTADGSVLVEGIDVVRIDDGGQLLDVRGFFGSRVGA